MITFEPDLTHYQKCTLLSRCFNNQGTVHMACHVPSGMMVVVKRLNLDKSKEAANLIQEEIIVTRQFQHPNILPYFAAFVFGSELCAISPLMGFGSCKDLLINHFTEGFPETAISYVLRDVLQGLDYIHKKGYIHRAIRASHVLISSTGRVCLTGLGYSCYVVENGRWLKNIHSFPPTTAQNLNWLSPELLEQNLQGYNERSDVYSVGVLTCELANGVEPFAETSVTLMLLEKVRGCAPPLLDCSTVPPLPLDDDTNIGDTFQNERYKLFAGRRLSEPLHAFAELCLQREPIHRPTASQLLNHSFLKNLTRNSGSGTGHKMLSLPELLRPVRPLQDERCSSNMIAEGQKQEPDDLLCVMTADKLAELEIDTCEWDF